MTRGRRGPPHDRDLYDPAGRAISVTGKRGIEAQKTYVSVPTAPADAYWAHGAPKSLTFGNGVVETTDFNNRLQLRELAAKLGAANRLTLTYTFSTANNGNIAAQNIAGPGGSVLESYTYDALNRLKTYTRAGGGSQTYVYDAFGNRAVLGTSYIPVSALTPQVSADLPANVQALFPGNRWTALGYDAAGNVASEAAGTGRSYTYDAENRVKTAAMPGTPAITYSYDGEGRRVRKELAGQATTVFVYDAAGQLAMEFGPAAGAEVQYLTADHLGSTRLVTDKNGAEVKRVDYLPFGEEYPAVGYPSATEKTLVKFTGKERDAETGLDYFGARYMSAAQGRFTSPDEFAGGPHDVRGSGRNGPGPLLYADITHPQSYNKYTYALNNPFTFVDPDGHEVRLAGDAEDIEEAKKRIVANASAKGEAELFRTVTDKKGKTTLVLDQKKAAEFVGAHSRGFDMLVETINSKNTVTVSMDKFDSRTSYQGPNATVFLNRDVAGIDKVAPMRDPRGNVVPNPFHIIAGHEVLGHARLHLIGSPAEHGDGFGSGAFGVENILRREQILPLRPKSSP